jgi:hypothetical protein
MQTALDETPHALDHPLRSRSRSGKFRRSHGPPPDLRHVLLAEPRVLHYAAEKDFAPTLYGIVVRGGYSNERNFLRVFA